MLRRLIATAAVLASLLLALAGIAVATPPPMTHDMKGPDCIFTVTCTVVD